MKSYMKVTDCMMFNCILIQITVIIVRVELSIRFSYKVNWIVYSTIKSCT